MGENTGGKILVKSIGFVTRLQMQFVNYGISIGIVRMYRILNLILNRF